MSDKLKQRGRDVAVLGVGMHPFGRFPEKGFIQLGREALEKALEDAGMEDARAIEAVAYSHTMGQTIAAGELVSYEFGMSGIPVLGNIENACSSSSTAVWLAKRLISAGFYDVIAVVGTEKMPEGLLIHIHLYFSQRMKDPSRKALSIRYKNTYFSVWH